MSPTELIADPQPNSLTEQKFRHEMGQISRQSFVFFAGTIFTAIAGYLFKVYLARVLGAEALGIYALGLTLTGFFGVFNGLGLPDAALRFVAVYSATQKWKELRSFFLRSSSILVVMNVALGVLLVAVGPFIAIRFYHAPALIRYLPLFAVIMILGVVNLFIGQVMAAYKDVTRRTVITSFIGNPLTMVFTILMITVGTGLWGYIFAQAAAAVVVFALLLFAAWKMTPLAARIRSYETTRLEPQVFSFSVAAFGIGLLGFLTGQTDKALIGFFLDVRSVGIYAVAATIVTFIPVLLQSVNQIFSPAIADLHTRGETELLKRLFQTLTKWILGLTIPLAAVVIILARPIMGTFGGDFEIGWPILVIGTLGQMINCGTGSVGYLLLMSGNQRRLVRVQAICGAFVAIANLALIPRWGIYGAAVAAALSVAFMNICLLREVRQCLSLWPYNRGYFRLLPATTAVIAFMLAFRHFAVSVHPVWIGILVSLMLAYAVFLGVLLLSGLNEDDRVLVEIVTSHLEPRARRNAPRRAPLVAQVSSDRRAEADIQTEGTPPIFIVGPSRSGTTLLARMLDAHPELAIFPETWCYVVLHGLDCFEEFTSHSQYQLFLNRLWDNLRPYNDPAAAVLAAEAASRPRYIGPVRPVLQSLGERYALAKGARYWGEKTPGHVLWLGKIRQLFPEAKLVASIRDPRDVVLSYDERWGKGGRNPRYLMRAAAQVRYYLRSLLDELANLESQLMLVRYETLTTEPTEVLRNICTFLGLPFDPRMLDFYRRQATLEANAPESRFHLLLKGPVTAERIGVFRNAFSPTMIAMIENCLNEELHQLGYPPEFSSLPDLNAEESRALAEGLNLYQQMRSGEIRQRLQRKVKLKNVSRQLVGRFAHAGKRYLAVTTQDWETRAREIQQPAGELHRGE